MVWGKITVMEIVITKASSTGPTALAAFDNCLLKMGIGNQNLIYLSSIIPPGSTLVREKAHYNNHFGNRLYVVMAQQRVIERHKQAWAGIGWVQDEKTKKGLFVEHHGFSHDQVTQDIHNTLEEMMKNRPESDWSKIKMEVEGIVCGDEPVCACVTAVYKSESWD